MKKLSVFVIILILASVVIADTSYGGWKENYRTKYSKKQLDPNSERAKKIKRLANPDTVFIKKWSMTDEERKAAGLPIKRTLSDHIMAWKMDRQDRDKFEKYESNFSSGNAEPSQAKGVKSGRTFKGFIQKTGAIIGDTLKDETSRINDRIKEEEVK